MSGFAGIFGEQKTMKQLVREQKRAVDKSIRELERERVGLERQEKKIEIEIKKMAKKNQMVAVTTMAKDLVRIRKNQEKFVNMQAQLRAVSLQMTEMQSTVALQQSLRSATRAMMVMNRQMNLPALQRIMMEFQKQTEQMEMKQEIMQDAIDDALENDEDQEEQDLIVGQVLDELGIKLGEDLANVPSKKRVEEEEDVKDKELEDRLANLKR